MAVRFLIEPNIPRGRGYIARIPALRSPKKGIVELPPQRPRPNIDRPGKLARRWRPVRRGARIEASWRRRLFPFFAVIFGRAIQPVASANIYKCDSRPERPKSHRSSAFGAPSALSERLRPVRRRLPPALPLGSPSDGAKFPLIMSVVVLFSTPIGRLRTTSQGSADFRGRARLRRARAYAAHRVWNDRPTAIQYGWTGPRNFGMCG